MSFRNGVLQVFNSNGKKFFEVGGCNVASYKEIDPAGNAFSVVKETKPGVYSVWPFHSLISYVFTGIESPTECCLDPVGELLREGNNKHKMHGMLFVGGELVHEGDFWFFKVDYTSEGKARGHQHHISYIVGEDNPEVHCIKFSTDMLTSHITFLEAIDDVPEKDLIIFKPL